MNEDPGWQLTLRTFVPFALQNQMRKGLDGLVMTRQLFLSFCFALLMFGVVIWFIGEREPIDDAGWIWLGVVVAWGVASLVLARLVDRPLDCTSDTALAASYRTRFFLRLGISESAALLGFLASFTGGPWWSYYVGMLFAFAGFARAAPSVRNIAADQERLSISGCRHSLSAVLRGPAAGGS